MKSLIQKLVESPGPSGYEFEIRDVILGEVNKLGDETRIDNLGNLIVRKGHVSADGSKIMVVAHIDEIGIIATHIDKDGFVRFLPVGGVQAGSCLSGRVRFLNGARGVIGIERLKDTKVAPRFEQMFIDMGVDNRQDCPVRVGDIAVFEGAFMDMGKRLISKAMDDRIGVAVLIETMRRMQKEHITSPHQIDFVFSVQEEVGLRGATAAAYGLEPDLGLAVDVTRSGDTPGGIKMEITLGEGPAIKVRDQGMLADPRVVQWMIASAEKSKIPYQLEVLEHGSTDARAIQLSRSGVPSGCLSIPCRYLHTPSEMVDYGDVQNAVRLIMELLRQPANMVLLAKENNP